MRFPFEDAILAHCLGPFGPACRDMMQHLPGGTQAAFFLATEKAKPHVANLERDTSMTGPAKMDAASHAVLIELEQAGLQLALVLVQLAVQFAVAYLRAQGGGIA